MQLEFEHVSLEVDQYATTGIPVCMLPGLGGGIKRFSRLGHRLADAGYRPVAINPRGAGASVGDLDDLRMHDLAGDVALVIERFGAPAVLIGNAFGNRVARYLSTARPGLVSALVLVCAGGDIPPEPDAARALQEFFDESLPDEQRLDAARRALFAEGNEVDPSFIDHGRSVAAAHAQMAATRAEPTDGWLGGGGAPMLVVQGAEDRIAPPENGHRLAERWPERVTVLDIPNAGHAVLNEQPDAVADAVVDFLAGIPNL